MYLILCGEKIKTYKFSRLGIALANITNNVLKIYGQI